MRPTSVSPLPRLLALTLVFLGLCIIPATSQAADLSGTWSASSLRVSWSIGDWGEACGPRPKGGGEKGGTVTLTPSGAGFKLKGLGRSYSTGQCWERMPGLSTRSKSAGSSAISATCRMPAGDPRQAKVITSWFPRGDRLFFDETGQYQFVVKGSNCTASVRRTRVLTRVVTKKKPLEKAPEEPEPLKKETATKVEAPETAPPPPPQRASRCTSRGTPVEFEVTPKTKLMRLGESFTFSAVARDKIGCRVPVATEWSLESKNGATLSSDGTLTIPENATTGNISLIADLGGERVQVSARIVTDKEFDQLIDGGSYGVLGESLDAAAIELSSGHVEVEQVETLDEPKNRALLLALAGLVAALGAAALFLTTKKRKIIPRVAAESLHEVHSESRDSDSIDTGANAAKADGPPPEPSLPRLCPMCGKRYEEGVQFCGEDGARLMRAN